jgi:hypothetical protein
VLDPEATEKAAALRSGDDADPHLPCARALAANLDPLGLSTAKARRI